MTLPDKRIKIGFIYGTPVEKESTGAESVASEGYMKPPNFLGVDGAKIFRDDICGRMHACFQADHRFYQSHGLYDFPQKDYLSRITNSILILLTKIPSMRKEIYSRRINAEIVKPIQKALKA